MLMTSDLALTQSLEKQLVIAERIIDKNPWRNELIKKQYAVAMAFAMKEHKLKYPKSTVKLIESFDNGPSDGFALAGKTEAFGVAGYLYSTEAFEASQLALTKKIPYLTPSSPLNAIKNDYAYSLAASHSDLSQSFAKLRQKFNHSSILISSENYLTNFEYSRIYQQNFNVVKTYKGVTAQVWKELAADLPNLVKNSDINILFTGFAFEQMDLIQLINSGSYKHKIHFIGHSQWGYSHKILEASLPETVQNLFVVTDYFDSQKLSENGYSLAKETIEGFKTFNLEVIKEPKIKGQDINEPIIFVLKDMISIVLEAAEKSTSRAEFNKNYSTLSYNGSAAEYRINNKTSARKVYQGTWENKTMKPLGTL